MNRMPRALAIAASLFALTSYQPAAASGMAEATEECQKLQGSSLPVGCTMSTVEGQPIFIFAFASAGASLNVDQTSALFLDVLTPVCTRQPVLVALLAVSPDGSRSVKYGACTPAEGIQFTGDWVPVEDDKPKVGT